MNATRLGLLALLLLSPLAFCQDRALSVARIFTDHMVLQRNRPMRVWGEASAGAVVRVALGSSASETRANESGRWQVELPARPAGGPYRLRITSGRRSIVFRDVQVGEVWICAGQSNMRWPLRRTANGPEAVRTAENPMLRLYDMVGAGSTKDVVWSREVLARSTPERFYDESGWQQSTPETAKDFSAVAYFFGLELQRRLRVPVGLVHNAVGGACIESYISSQGLRENRLLRAAAEWPGCWLENPHIPAWCRQRAHRNLSDWTGKPTESAPGHPFQPSFLFEAGIRPLARLGVGGVIWYQGESNATLADNRAAADMAECKAEIEVLIADWRRAFGQKDLPFLFVQLPGMGRPWMEFRQVQRECLSIPNTGMAVTIDLGHPQNVHPRRKREVGRRLALIASAQFHDEDIVHGGPWPGQMSREGGQIILPFLQTAGRLSTSDGNAPRGFELAGASEAWQPAVARLRGNAVVLASSSVGDPRAVRYGWSPFPDCNLVGGTGLPAAPFRIGKFETQVRRSKRKEGDRRPSVLFIAIDDLRPELGCYGNRRAKTPHLDRLAQRGLLFDRAYVSMAVCCPSRTAVLTGLRPDTTRVWRNTHFRAHLPDCVTLPQHFKKHGYVTQGIGKIYHDAFDPRIHPYSIGHDEPSWSIPFYCPGPRYYYTEKGIEIARRHYQRRWRVPNPSPDEWTTRWCPGLAMEAPEIEDGLLYDGEVADRAIAALRQFADNEGPFFLAAGFLRPHLPFVAPKRYWDLHDPAHVNLAGNPTAPRNAPALALHDSPELRYYEDVPAKGRIPDDLARRLIQGYQACCSFVDAQVGRILAELERLGLDQKTIVVVWGDHGWHLGEHGLWGKTTNFENDTRVPLIIRVPGMKSSGRRSRALVELIDLYPTLADLARLPRRPELEGKSLRPLLDNPDAAHKQAVYSQFPRGGNVHRGGEVMGYSMRTERYRYTEWVKRSGGTVVARELYDHITDPGEDRNVAAVLENSSLVAGLAERMRVDLGSVAAREQQTEVLLQTGFEDVPAGPFTTLSGAGGAWTAARRHAEIDPAHQRNGRHSLHLLGGKERSTIFAPKTTSKRVASMSFWAERWTRRAPFVFVVEGLVAGKWRQLYCTKSEIVIGGFKTHVQVAFGAARVSKLRFTCTSPEGSGILIDDLELHAARPGATTEATTLQPMLPALLGNRLNPVALVRITVPAGRKPRTLTEIHLNTMGTTDLADVARVSVFFAGSKTTLDHRRPDAVLSDDQRFGRSQPAKKSLVFKGRRELPPGASHFWVSFELTPSANIDHRVDAGCDLLRFADGKTLRPVIANPAGAQRLGVALRSAGQRGAAAYRIPGLSTTTKGTLIAVYDIRWKGWGDLPADIDVGISRSTDGGRTWSPMKVIMDQGRSSRWKGDGVGDPSVLVDRRSGTIWVAGIWSHGDRAWTGSQPGLEPEETGQLLLVKSEDDGKTWSRPINITRMVKRPEWCFLLQGPGRGITMSDGTLVFPAQYQETAKKGRTPHATVLFSRDQGRTWHLGTGVRAGTTEAQVAETEDGVLMLNVRDNRGGARSVYTTRDLGSTWQVHPSSRRALPEPVCNASLINVDRDLGRKSRGLLLFSNPAVTRAPRSRMTIKTSEDGGLTWPKTLHTLVDEGRSAGYSSLTMIDERTVGILFEGSRAHLTFLRIPLTELVTPTRR